MLLKLLLFETTPESFYDLELFGKQQFYKSFQKQNNHINKTILNEKNNNYF